MHHNPSLRAAIPTNTPAEPRSGPKRNQRRTQFQAKHHDQAQPRRNHEGKHPYSPNSSSRAAASYGAAREKKRQVVGKYLTSLSGGVAWLPRELQRISNTTGPERESLRPRARGVKPEIALIWLRGRAEVSRGKAPDCRGSAGMRLRFVSWRGGWWRGGLDRWMDVLFFFRSAVVCCTDIFGSLVEYVDFSKRNQAV